MRARRALAALAGTALAGTALTGTCVITAVPASAVVPGSNAKIAFASNRGDGSDFDIFVMNADGTGQTAVGGSPVDDIDPAWSPDGARIAFASKRAGGTSGFDIWIMNADGTNATRLTTEDGDDTQPAWSPDGTKIAYRFSEGADQGDIYVRNADGTGSRSNLTNTSASDNAHPEYSPDGTKIGFDRIDPADADRDVFTMNSDGTTKTNRTSTAPGDTADDSDPSWSPDGGKLAFVSDRDTPGGPADETDNDIWQMNVDGTSPTPVTTNSDKDDNAPVYSPDGTTIAYATDEAGGAPADDDVNTIKTGGTDKTPLTTDAKDDTTPSWQRDFEQIVRVAGADRIETAIEVSKRLYPNPGTAKAVVIARSDNFPDALAGTALAAAKDAPILLTGTAGLDSRAVVELLRVLQAGQSKTVYLLGGTAALAPAVENAVNAIGYVSVRVGGADRFETARLIAEQTTASPTRIFLATGLTFQDAIVAGVAAAKVNGVVVLTNGTTLPATTQAYLNSKAGVPRTAVGTPAKTADPSATAIDGADQYETSRLVAQQFFTDRTSVSFASGTTFPDGLTGGVFSAEGNRPLLLVEPTSLPATIKAYLLSVASTVTGGFVYGGPAAISDTVLNDAKKAISGVA